MFRILSYVLMPLAVALFFYWRHFFKHTAALLGITGKTRTLLLWLVPVAGGALILGAFSAVGILYLHFIILCLFSELVALFLKNGRIRSLLYTGFPALVLTLLIGVCAYVNMCTVRETDYTVRTDKDLSQSYTAVLITDTHYGHSLNAERLTRVCENISALKPDVLLLGGDIVDESTEKEGVKEIFSLLGSVQTRYGVYYVSGNHDRGTYRKGNENNIEEALAGTGIVWLQDEAVPLGEDLLLVGRRDFGDRARQPVSDLLSGQDGSRFTVVLDHQPRQYAENAAAGVDLTLSGHTHAGQIFPAGFLTPLFGSEINYGLTERDGMTAIVSSGASGWRFPLRTSRHSEFVCIRLTAE